MTGFVPELAAALADLSHLSRTREYVQTSLPGDTDNPLHVGTTSTSHGEGARTLRCGPLRFLRSAVADHDQLVMVSGNEATPPVALTTVTSV